MTISLSAQETFVKTQEDLRADFDPDPTLVDQLPDLRGLQAVICICVAAFAGQEEHALRQTMRELSKLTDNRWKALVFCNWPADTQPDACLDVVRACGNQNVHLLQHTVPAGTPIGRIRKMIHDAVAVRGHDALVHITMDADTVWVHPNLVQGFITMLEKNADACVGQLDWDNREIPTSSIPTLLVGQEMMRLLPKYGNKQIITAAKGDTPLLREAIFSRRSFGRGVQSNFAFTNAAYKRAGGYLPQPHDEFDSLLRRIWLSRFLSDGRTDAITFGWGEDGIAVRSDSRRALWALAQAGKPPMRQWDDIPFVARDRVRTSLPCVNGHRRTDVSAIEQTINLTLEAFNLPTTELSHAICASLAEIGLGANDYDIDFRSYTPDPSLSTAHVTIKKTSGLVGWLARQ